VSTSPIVPMTLRVNSASLSSACFKKSAVRSRAQHLIDMTEPQKK
jgi:hypothetical protein